VRQREKKYTKDSLKNKEKNRKSEVGDDKEEFENKEGGISKGSPRCVYRVHSIRTGLVLFIGFCNQSVFRLCK
jgi:hypothetical protein